MTATMSSQFELALREYIAMFDGSQNISAAVFRSRFNFLYHEYLTYEARSKAKKHRLTRDEVFEVEAAKLAKGTKVALIHLREVGLGCVAIKLRMTTGKKETNTRVLQVIEDNKVIACKEVKESFKFKAKKNAKNQEKASNNVSKLLSDMIKKRQWDLLSVVSPDTLRAAAQEDLSGEKGSLLHLALQFDAPSSIISQLAHDMHLSVSHRDAEGRLPLHLAIRKARASVVKHLLKLNPSACTSTDCQGQTPLHSCFDEDVKNSFNPRRFSETVRCLVYTSPEPLIMEDEQSRCPIELALLSEAPLKTYMFMHKEKCYARENSS